MACDSCGSQYEESYSDVQAWGYTIKDNRTETTDYESWFTNAERLKCKIVSKSPEYDSKGKLHYHGVIEIPKRFYRKRLMQKGLHLHLQEITDMADGS